MTIDKQLLSAGAANVTIRIDINAPIAKTWRLMIDDIGQWWRQDFLCCERSMGMHLEARVGGMLVERTEGEGCGYLWGHVISFQPEHQLAYVAQIVPPWGGPAQSVVQIALAPDEDRPAEATVLTLTDSLIGHVSDHLMSSLAEGWGQLYGEGGLKTHVESST
ncbi:MAG: SRPBCC domain-containing protein [Verrucomicrobiae bacterium]|nr:SRPBCC domain-containing protein [Verrucomicrobiae bacterium]